MYYILGHFPKVTSVLLFVLLIFFPFFQTGGSGSPSSSSTALNKPFIPPQPPLQQKPSRQGLPGVDKRVWNKLPISYFQFVFIAIALLVGAVILLYTPSKLAKSRQSGQNGRVSASGWRNPYLNDYKALTENVVCKIEQFEESEITQEIFSKLFEDDNPKILVPSQGVSAWSSSSHLWHLGKKIFDNSFG